MNAVTPIQPQVNGPTAPIERVIAWAEAQADKGDMGGASSRIRVTSLRQMAELVAADEPKTAVFILDNIERLRDRWATKNIGKTETAKTYASRAKTTLEEYLRWSEAPGKYDPKRTPTRTGRKPKVETKDLPASAVAGQSLVATAPTPSGPTPSGVAERNFPLGEGRGAVLFTLPPEGVKFADVRKFAVHLFTLATDFNITDESQAKTFAMVVRGGSETE